jgi:hypothetical protein
VNPGISEPKWKYIYSLCGGKTNIIELDARLRLPLSPFSLSPYPLLLPDPLPRNRPSPLDYEEEEEELVVGNTLLQTDLVDKVTIASTKKL